MFCIELLIYLISFIREVDLVKYLNGFMLNCFNFNMMRWKLSLSLTSGLLDSFYTISSNRVSPCLEEVCQFLHQALTAVEESRGKPEQFPSSFLTSSHWIVSQLLHDLTVNLVP